MSMWDIFKKLKKNKQDKAELDNGTQDAPLAESEANAAASNIEQPVLDEAAVAKAQDVSALEHKEDIWQDPNMDSTPDEPETQAEQVDSEERINLEKQIEPKEGAEQNKTSDKANNSAVFGKQKSGLEHNKPFDKAVNTTPTGRQNKAAAEKCDSAPAKSDDDMCDMCTEASAADVYHEAAQNGRLSEIQTTAQPIPDTGVPESAPEPKPTTVNKKANTAADTEAAANAALAAELAEKPAAEQKKKSLFAKLKDGLKKTRDSLLGSLFVENGEKIDDEFYDELEEAMIISDMGMATTEKLLGRLRSELKENGIHTRTEAKQVMIRLLADCMRPDDKFLENSDKTVMLIVGVNGVGKTTSIGKLAALYKAEGKSVMLAAGDTFRAAAAEQLTIWAERAGVPIVKHGEGADPAAVVFDAIASFRAKKCDMLICDTAGRLHNKKNLMNELSKIGRVIERELPDANVEVLLVLDATTGQNAIAQAKVFGENTGLTGIILTKLDGTAKGGVVVAVKDELGLPVRYVGVGEGIDDLQPFDPDAFANALL